MTRQTMLTADVELKRRLVPDYRTGLMQDKQLYQTTNSDLEGFRGKSYNKSKLGTLVQWARIKLPDIHTPISKTRKPEC